MDNNIDKYHGRKVRLIQGISEVHKKGMVGTVTAYLPEDPVFAIWFEGINDYRRWVTFEEDEETFLRRIELVDE